MQKTISSSFTFIYKIILPSIALGLIGAATIALFINNDSFKWPSAIILLLVYFFVALPCFRIKHVTIDGEELVISNYLKSIRVHVSNIEKVSESIFINIHPIWIHFIKRTEFGKKIRFMPPTQLIPFRSHPIVRELIKLAENNSYQNSQNCINNQ